jgi:hypothetical protein
MARNAAQVLRLAPVAGFTGWITPAGRRVPCTSGGHLDAAAVAGETRPDDAGWVHVVGGVADPVARATPRQVDALVALSLETGEALPWWLADAV